MKILFNLDYRTAFGEQLMLNVVDADKPVEHYEMSTLNGEQWFVEISKSAKSGTFIDYYYSVYN